MQRYFMTYRMIILSRLCFIVVCGMMLVSCAKSRTGTPEPDRPIKTGGPKGMVWIPGGEFMMGATEEHAAENAMPIHMVKVDGFWMDETEVTNKEYRSFVDATGYKTVAERRWTGKNLRSRCRLVRQNPVMMCFSRDLWSSPHHLNRSC